jgi:hypothetical protein
MNSERKNAIFIGVLFILASASSILTYPFLGFLLDTTADYLTLVNTKVILVLVGMLIELIWTLSVLGIPIMLYSVLKKQNGASARWYLGLRFIEAISTFMATIILLTLIPLSKEYIDAGSPSDSYYQTFGSLMLAARDWIFLLGPGLIFALSALVLNLNLVRSRAVPRWISIWGLAGAILMILSYLLEIFVIDLRTYLAIPIGVQEMVFAIWIIIKGFNFPKKDGN